MYQGACNSCIDLRALQGPGDFVKKDKNTWQSQELIDEGKRVQQKSHDSLARSNKLIASAEAMGAETNVALKAQTEQMRSTNQDISEVDAGITRANTGAAPARVPKSCSRY